MARHYAPWTAGDAVSDSDLGSFLAVCFYIAVAVIVAVGVPLGWYEDDDDHATVVIHDSRTDISRLDDLEAEADAANRSYDYQQERMELAGELSRP